MASTNWSIRIFKSWGARDLSRAWVNNYELVSATALTPAELVPTLNTLVAAEKPLHFTTIQFLQATISTWQADSKPYDPSSFITVGLAGAGTRPVSTNMPLDSNITLFIQYQVASGRQGRRFYRGCLAEEDVLTGGDGKMTIEAASGYQDTGTAMVALRAALAPVLPAGAANAKLFLLGKGITFPVTARAVTDVHLGGVVVNKRNHRYFDRAAVA